MAYIFDSNRVLSCYVGLSTRLLELPAKYLKNLYRILKRQLDRVLRNSSRLSLESSCTQLRA